MGTSTVAKRTRSHAAPKPYVDRAPHDPRTDVKLAGDWLDRWLGVLEEKELRAYLQLAHYCNTRTYHDKGGLARILEDGQPERVLARLERRGLLEVIRKAQQFHYHFPHRDSDGYHRGERARPSLVDALAFQERMTEELTALAGQDETEALREEAFARYPELREEHELYYATADPSAPRWRLWMEVSNLLIRRFEELYGSLREDHGALFKEVSAKVLAHHLELVDGVVAQVLERLERVFPEVQTEWAIAPDREEFVALPFIRRQAQRYGVGPEQILLNVIEALGQSGRVVCSVDETGQLTNMVLPSDTGLTKSEERVLFLTPEERASEDSARNRERVRRARNKYANYLIERACSTLADFVTAGRVPAVDPWLDRIVELVNEALELLPMQFDREHPVKLEHVIDRFDALKLGQRLFALPDAVPTDTQAVRRATHRMRALQESGDDEAEAEQPPPARAPRAKAKKTPAKKKKSKGKKVKAAAPKAGALGGKTKGRAKSAGKGRARR